MDIKNSADLRAAILKLKEKQQSEKKELMENFHEFAESMKPINLIKSTFHKVKESPDLTSNILKATLGLGVGIVSKKLFLGKAPGLFKRLAGSAIQMGLAGLVSKQSDTIKSTGSRLLRNIFRSRVRHRAI